MKHRNIHGDWEMFFSDRMLQSELIGSFNKEGGQAWFKEMKERVLTSPDRDERPWATLINARNWDMASSDSWDTNNELANWMPEHNCVLFAVVLSKKIQEFAVEKGMENQKIMKLFFDYDEAHQACLDALFEAQNQPNK
ncbi:hypothetical protein L4C34_20040 [Vibrio profundum]|uniref:hypothetical protein n=1 Tax=Vibrio profundum TaxID=2910247 RepID=UPI003D11E7BC